MELGVTIYVPRRRVSVDAPETPTFQMPSDVHPNYTDLSVLLGQLNLPLGANVLEVLVPKDKHLAFGSVERELVKAVLAELRDLDSTDFSAEVGAKMLEPSLGRKEVGLCAIGSQARVDMLCSQFSVVR